MAFTTSSASRQRNAFVLTTACILLAFLLCQLTVSVQAAPVLEPYVMPETALGSILPSGSLERLQKRYTCYYGTCNSQGGRRAD
ncbi:MAG: hypothetical protein J3Q66DRAFT_336029 [Benniella sp.]|nr:MAG: hypothetical protein J3Q66DRAFT_336029 [Benniella sp.]